MPFHLALGGVAVVVHSDCRAVLEDLRSLYGSRTKAGSAAGEPIRIAVRRGRRRLLGGARYSVFGDGKRIFADCRPSELLPYLEWAINMRVVDRCADFLQLHAATMVRSGRAFVFAGSSGSGKSTLAAGLLSRGWEYFSDEFALIDPCTLHAHPFPKALCVRSGSFDTVRRLGLPTGGLRRHVKAGKGPVFYVRPPRVLSEHAADSRPVRFVVLPRYRAGGQSRLRPISRGEATLELARCVFNRSAFGDRTTSLLGRIARNAQCYSLDCGSLDDACELLEALSTSQSMRDGGKANDECLMPTLMPRAGVETVGERQLGLVIPYFLTR